MPVLHEKYRILLWISLALFAGFVASGVAAYLIAGNADRENTVVRGLPATSDAVNAEIRAEMMRPLLAASLLAGDQRLRDWLAEGEPGGETIAVLLEEIRKNHGAQRVLLASERSRRSYGADGASESLQESSGRDAWFFHARNAKATANSSLTPGRTDDRTAVLSGVMRILDRDGAFLGAVMVESGTERIARIMDAHRSRDGSRIHLVDARQRILPAGGMATVTGSVDALPGMREIARELLHGGSAPVTLQYRKNGDTVFAVSRFIPELGVHLIVERVDHAGAETAVNLFLSSLLIGAAVTLLCVVLMLLTVHRYHARLEQMAGSDPLTGLLNRQAFEIVFRQALLESDRSARPLSGILFDVDFIGQVNEMHGYAAGDEVLRTIARIARAMLRESDMLTRWNGEEFFVLLKECPIEQAVAVAEKIRGEIDRNDFSAMAPDRHITVSLGVAQHEPGETASIFLRRADEALFKAKANGRNRLHVARRSGASDTVAPASS